ncbi:nucleoporin autopeptidase-domain-containing protein [Gloeopeniophorella convolvens]|nr:nucleoporin autopeptidase-domain-containing protein [Gloeopeniophorella convolvens]
MFGATKPATGFGAFGGGTSAFGSGGGGFGSTNTPQPASSGTGLFGQSNATTGGAFGSGAFGGKPATSAFGTTSANPNAGPYDGVPPVTTGTANPTYSAFAEKDSANASVTLQYQSITCMPQYRGNSFEELRTQDYQQNRKTAGSNAFGQSAFGSTSQPATTGLFGQAAQQQPANPAFGSFGNTGANANTGSAFGQNTPQSTGGFGTFGQASQPQAQQPTTGAFGSFGQPQQQQGGGLFGAGGAGAGAGAGGAFGQNKPLGGFGATGTGAFGSNTNATGPTGLFGQSNAAQPAAAPTGGLFGQGQQTGGAFGGNGFGTNNAAQKPPVFGQTVPPQPASGGGFGLFGPQQQQQTAPGQQGPTGLFGNQPAFGQSSTPQTGQPQQGGVFGNTTQQPSGGLFGNTGGGGGLFNNTQQQPANQQQPGQPSAFGLFANKTATPTTGGGIFGNNALGQTNTTTAPQQSTGLFGSFGQSTTQPANNAFGSSTNLFGGRPSAPVANAAQSIGQPLGGSMPQGSLQASIAQPIATNLPIFSMLPTSSSPSLDSSVKKKVNLLDSARPPVSRSIAYQPVQTRLRGYTSITTSTSLNNGLSLSLTTGKPNALSLSVTASPGKGQTGPESFSSSVLNSESRSSFKKLVLDKKIDAADLLKRSSASPSPKKPTFNPSLTVAAREKEAATPPPSVVPTLTRPSHGRGTPRAASGDPQSSDDNHNASLQDGDYSVEPSLSTLSKLGYEALAEVKGLVVKRAGYGEIQFLEPVDLTTLTKLSDLLGEQVRFDEMECSVYPDSDDVDKPPPGSGLNVRARITLFRCWPLDKATRQPIKDEKHPSAIKHLKRLKNMKETTFETFDITEGKWTFTVDHF